MPVQNARIAAVLDEIADLLEIENGNPFRIRAYRRAARTVESLPRDVGQLIAKGETLTGFPGIGKDLAGKIAEIAKTGSTPVLKELEHEVPAGLADLLRLEGLGPKRVHLLHEKLGISNLTQLDKAIGAGKLKNIRGLGDRTVEKIRHSLQQHRAEGQRVKLPIAEQEANALVAWLQQTPGVLHAIVAGSLRRRKETVGDIDILVTGGTPAAVMGRFVAYDEVAEVVSRGSTRASVILKSGIHVDLRLIAGESYGAALHYFTGSKDHNLAIRRMAMRRGLKVNEYGVFKGKRRIAGKTESEVYETVGLPYIEPELREAAGEIEAAAAHRLPHLVHLEDICGDLHVHSTATDGRNSIAEMAVAAHERGYRYIALTDHSRHVRVAHGLDPKALARQIDQIEKINETMRGFCVLKSCEVDILEDGKLDLPDSILERLDLVVGAIHYKFDLPQDRQTERVLRAMDNRFFNIFAHATGRLIGERSSYEIDIERLIAGALERHCYLELNAQPERLDLDASHCRLAKNAGLKLSIATDAHSTAQLAYMRYGVDQARRGWLCSDDVLNSRPLNELRALLRR